MRVHTRPHCYREDLAIGGTQPMKPVSNYQLKGKYTIHFRLMIGGIHPVMLTGGKFYQHHSTEGKPMQSVQKTHLPPMWKLYRGRYASLRLQHRTVPIAKIHSQMLTTQPQKKYSPQIYRGGAPLLAKTKFSDVETKPAAHSHSDIPREGEIYKPPVTAIPSSDCNPSNNLTHGELLTGGHTTDQPATLQISKKDSHNRPAQQQQNDSKTGTRAKSVVSLEIPVSCTEDNKATAQSDNHVVLGQEKSWSSLGLATPIQAQTTPISGTSVPSRLP